VAQLHGRIEAIAEIDGVELRDDAVAVEFANARERRHVDFRVADAAAYAANAAADAADAATRGGADAAREKIILAMRADFEVLLRLAKQEKWTGESPADPDRLGPLWPLGKPDGWPEGDTAAPPVLRIDITVPPGMTPEQSKEFNLRVAKFYAALSGLDAAMGGHGLRILDEGSCEIVPATDEMPVRTSGPSRLVGTGA
ncbi:MAG: hypothetical protein ACKVW3_13565, partial [Phycisphaerales bacterium]